MTAPDGAATAVAYATVAVRVPVGVLGPGHAARVADAVASSVHTWPLEPWALDAGVTIEEVYVGEQAPTFEDEGGVAL